MTRIPSGNDKVGGINNYQPPASKSTPAVEKPAVPEVKGPTLQELEQAKDFAQVRKNEAEIEVSVRKTDVHKKLQKADLDRMQAENPNRENESLKIEDAGKPRNDSYGGPPGSLPPEGAVPTFSGPGQPLIKTKTEDGITFGGPGGKSELPNIPEHAADAALRKMTDYKERTADLKWGDHSRLLWARQHWPETGYGPRPTVITLEDANQLPEMKAFDQAKMEADSRFTTARQFYRQASIEIHNGNQKLGNELYAIGRSFEAEGNTALSRAEQIYDPAMRRDQGMKNLADASLAAPKGLFEMATMIGPGEIKAAMAGLRGVYNIMRSGVQAGVKLAGGVLLKTSLSAGKEGLTPLSKLSFEECVKVGQMSQGEAIQFLSKYQKNVTPEIADDFVKYSRGRAMEQALQDSRKFSKLTAEQLNRFSNGAIRTSDAEKMLEALRKANPQELQALGTRESIMTHCELKSKDASTATQQAAADLQKLVLSDQKLAQQSPKSLMELADKSGMKLDETQAKQLIASADARLKYEVGRLKPEGAIEAMKARGDTEGAKRLESFLDENGSLDPSKMKKPRGVDVDGAAREVTNPGPLRRPAGQQVNVRELENDFGYDPFTAEHLNAKAKEHGVIIEMKPTNPESLDMIKRGEALAKPEGLKATTTNTLDLELGAPKGSEGKVTFFEPQKPAGFDKLPKDHPLVERYNKRMEQWKEYETDMAELQKPLDKRSPEFQEKMRRQYGTDVPMRRQYGKEIPLEIEIKNGVVYDKATGKPFTGDYDLWAIRDAETKELVDPARAQKVYDDLGLAGNPQHGPGTANWSPTTESQKKIKEGLIRDHDPNNPNAKNLLIFDGSGLPSTGWAK